MEIEKFSYEETSSFEVNRKRDLECHVGAPHYVRAIDRFMSGWGRAEKGHSYILVACPNLEIAQHVQKICEGLEGLRQIHICDEQSIVFSKENHYSLYTFRSGPKFFGIMGWQPGCEENKKFLRGHGLAPFI